MHVQMNSQVSINYYWAQVSQYTNLHTAIVFLNIIANLYIA